MHAGHHEAAGLEDAGADAGGLHQAHRYCEGCGDGADFSRTQEPPGVQGLP